MMLTIRTNKQVDDDLLALTSCSSWYTAVIWTSIRVDDLFFCVLWSVFCAVCVLDLGPETHARAIGMETRC